MDKFVLCFAGKDYEVSRSQVELSEILGEGQFGDVHKGIYTEKVCWSSESVCVDCVCQTTVKQVLQVLLVDMCYWKR